MRYRPPTAHHTMRQPALERALLRTLVLLGLLVGVLIVSGTWLYSHWLR